VIDRRRERLVAAAAVLIVAAGVAGLLIYNRIAAENIGKGAYIPHKEKITPEVQLLRQYVRINTTNPPGNEIAGARWLGARLDRFHIPYEIIEPAPGRANLYARIRGTTPGQALLLLSHIDVVPASGQGWTRPPFSGDIQSNNLWGRGAIDMKSIGVAHMEAFIAVAKKGRPKHDVILLATADEEEGGANGTAWLLQHRPDVFADVTYTLAEGGITEMERGAITYYGIEVGTKQNVAVTVTAPTREQLQKVRIHLERYFVRDQPDRILPEIDAFFRQIAPVRVETRDLLSDIHRTIATGKFWLLPMPYRALTQDFLLARTIYPKDGKLHLTVAMSNLPDASPDERIAWLAREIAPFGATIESIDRKEGPVPLSPANTPLFAILDREVRRAFNPQRFGTEVLATSLSDSRFLRPRGITCYGFQPFPVDYYQSRTIHGVDERVTIDAFTQGVEVMRQVVLAYAGQ